MSHRWDKFNIITYEHIITYELLQEHLGTNLNSAKDGTTGAHKHKTKGYQLFKDKYVKQVVVKPDVKKGNNHNNNV